MSGAKYSSSASTSPVLYGLFNAFWKPGSTVLELELLLSSFELLLDAWLLVIVPVLAFPPL